MKPQTIKKGLRGILHLPRFKKAKNIYTQTIEITESMFHVKDEKPLNGWSKLWGIGLGQIHWHNSYRFVFRVIDGELKIGYYAYIGGVSPQDNKEQKGYFTGETNTDIGSDDPVFRKGDTLHLLIDFDNVVVMEISHHSKIDCYMNFYEVLLPLPKSWKWPITECYPNLKQIQDRDIHFKFI